MSAIGKSTWTKTYDTRCDALARVFLSDRGSFTEDEVKTLAGDVQQTIEDFVESRPSVVAAPAEDEDHEPGFCSCYVCGTRLHEGEYFSDRRTDSGDVAGVVVRARNEAGGFEERPASWGDVALVLCKDCSTKGEAMPDAEAYAFYSAGKHWPTKKYWTLLRVDDEEGQSLDVLVVPDDALPLSDLSVGALGYYAGYAAAVRDPEIGSAAWAMERLKGRQFPEEDGARDFLQQALETEHAEREAAEQARRAKLKERARYEVSFTLIVEDDHGGCETDVEEVVATILGDVIHSRTCDEAFVVRGGLKLHDACEVSAEFGGMVAS